MPATASATNVETIKAVYSAFGRGDVPAILEMLSDDVRWEHWENYFAHREGVAWLEPRTGREGAAEFFEVVGTFDIAEFSVLDIMASDQQVAATILIDAKVPGGGRLRDEEIHLWTFDTDGRICAMRHYADTAKHIAAANGEDTTAR
ncbi:MAG TPA: nuclear transport factor 2 family protein [Solirubrobacterales bacterium]|nr:nuclear transport factor 2 family protein [Solirubrobacterales bacterium]